MIARKTVQTIGLTMNKSHEELQDIEHFNKILREHKELMHAIKADVKESMTNHIATLKEFAKALTAIQVEISLAIKNIYSSAQEVRRATGHVNEIISYTQSIIKLEQVLSDEKVQKVLALLKDKHE